MTSQTLIKMEVRKESREERRKRVTQKLRRRAVKRALTSVRTYLNDWHERQMKYQRLSAFNRSYYVKHDYSVEPIEELINNESEQVADPYEGEDMFNIDHMNED